MFFADTRPLSSRRNGFSRGQKNFTFTAYTCANVMEQTRCSSKSKDIFVPVFFSPVNSSGDFKEKEFERLREKSHVEGLKEKTWLDGARNGKLKWVARRIALRWICYQGFARKKQRENSVKGICVAYIYSYIYSCIRATIWGKDTWD